MTDIVAIGPGQVGIFYATTSRVLLHKIRHDPGDPVIHHQLREGESGFVVSQSRPYHDYAARQMIAAATGQPALDELDERAVIIEDGVVLDAHQRDPEFYPLQPGERGTHLVRHRHAAVGDRWDGTKFARRHVKVDKMSGKIVGDVDVEVGNDGCTVPPETDVHIHVVSPTYQIGETHEFPEHVKKRWLPVSS